MVDHGGQGAGLDRHDDQVVGAVQVLGGDSGYRDRFLTTGPDQAQLGSELLGTPGTDQEGDVTAGLDQSGPEVPAGGTGSGDQDPH